jgi:hypothetical protein
LYSEKLTLEIQSLRRGLTPRKPPTARGTSGIVHLFSFIAADELMTYCFDIYDEVTEIEVLKSYIKKIDTGYAVSLVTGGRVGPLGKSLAKEYGMAVVSPNEIPEFLRSKVLTSDA